MLKTARLNCSTLLKFAMQGKRLTRFFTIVLSAFSFMLFSLASCGFTFSYSGYIVRGYLNSVSANTETVFMTSALSLPQLFIDKEDVDMIADETGLEFVYYYSYRNSELAELSYAGCGVQTNNKDELTWIANSAVGSEETLAALGVEFLAGNIPQGVYEVAVSEAQYEFFRSCGYWDDSVNYYFDENEGIYRYAYSSDENHVDPQGGETVSSYSDLLGKQFVMYGDPETGVLDKTSIFKVKVVGIYHNKLKNAEYLVDEILLSEEWHEVFETEKNFCTAMFTRALTTSAESQTALNVTRTLAEKYRERYATNAYPLIGIASMVGKLNEQLAIDGNYFASDVGLLAAVFGVAGVFFGIFAVLLNGYCITASLDLKRRKIGVLRSLGTGKREIARIYLLEALFIGLCVFALALTGALGIYFGYLRPLLWDNVYNICFFAYNGWNVLILSAFSFGVPILATLIKLKKFFKKTIVENITNNPQSTRKSKK